jgi:hypothetical protein
MSENSPLNSDNKNTNNEVTVSDTMTNLPEQIEEDTYIFDAADYPSESITTEASETEDDRDTAQSVSDVVNEPVEMRHASTHDDADTSAETVVVTKQIIQRQTVVVRDTIFIIE